MATSLEHRDASISILPRPNGRRLIKVLPKSKSLYVPYAEWETAYPVELIQQILDVKGPDYLCDEIMRDEDPEYVQQNIARDIFAYFDAADFAGKLIFDFGCGSGASTAILARMFPTSEIVGVELREDFISVARKRFEFYGLTNARVLRSPSGTELPPDIGQFDLVIMSAVFEHLLPEERRLIMPKVWAVIREGGYLFINQTPNLMCPMEGHTTGLPLINYLPKPLALAAARRFSNRVARDESWESLLRKGIRGATEREVLRVLKADANHQARLLEPDKNGLRDRVDLWYTALSMSRMRAAKRILKILMKVTWYGFGFTFMPNLTLVIHKRNTS